MGFALIIPCSLAKAIIDPLKVIAPIIIPIVFIIYWFEPLNCSDKEIQTADIPPKELKMAIICGSEVIFTFSPDKIPIAVPDIMIRHKSNLFSISLKKTAVKMANNTPNIPI